MLSEKQLLANQQNALRSTGPRTAAGKAIASQNAIRHGLRAEHTVIPGEDVEEFDSFRQMMLDDLAPAGALEVMLTDRIVAGFWKLHRAGRIETEMLDHLRQPLLAKHQQQRTDSWGPLFGDITSEDLPSGSSQFQSCEQAIKAWDATDDGIAYAEGKIDQDSANDSFLTFLRQCRNLDFEPKDRHRVDLPAAITAMRDESAHDSKIFVLFAEIEQRFRAIACVPFSRLSVPATRLFLRDMGSQVFASGCSNEDLLEKVSQGIMELEHIEKSIEKRISPNLGQALSDDFEGSNRLAKFLRYEGHIERSLYKALSELQKLQILRSNRWIPDQSDQQAQSPPLEP